MPWNQWRLKHKSTGISQCHIQIPWEEFGCPCDQDEASECCLASFCSSILLRVFLQHSIPCLSPYFGRDKNEVVTQIILIYDFCNEAI